MDSEIYHSVLDDLKNNKYVLYSGTPCQIGALKKFLDKDYDTLLTVSFICHGVPSPALWKQYVSEQAENYSSNITYISHRSKKSGWTNFSMAIQFENESEYCVSIKHDPYLQLFLKNTCLRDSCYSCQYKGKEHLAFIDIILADKWGTVSGSLPNMYDDKGISLIFVQTVKGQSLWNMIQESIYSDKTAFEEATEANMSYNESSVASAHKEAVLSEIGKTSVSEIYKRYAKTPLIIRIKVNLKKILYKAAKLCGIVWLVRRVRHKK